MRFPEDEFGVLPASNGVGRLVRIIGAHWARYLVIGDLIADADKALVMGLVHEVWPDAGFQDRALEVCRHLARQNSEQMGAAKIAIEMARDLGPEMGRHVERVANSALMLAPDYLEGMKRHVSDIGAGAGAGEGGG